MASKATGIAAAAVVATTAIVAGGAALNNEDPPPPPALSIKVDAETGLPGCSVPTAAPVPEPCVATWSAIKAMLTSVQMAELFKKWKTANPGEYKRVTQFMAEGTGTAVPQMNTPYGSSLIQAVQAYIYTWGPQPLRWPQTPPQAPAGSKDRQAPTSPGLEIIPPPSPQPTVPG